MGNKKRIAKWDNVRLILIILVVVGHVAESYMGQSVFLSGLRFFIYTFHMPAFIFVSGLFSKNVINNKRWDKITKYILFYFVLKIIKYIAGLIVNDRETFRVLHESGSPWFVLALFFMFAITFYTKEYECWWVLICSLVLSVFAGYTTENTQFLVFLRVINFYPFFYLGYIIEPKKILVYAEKSIVKRIAWLLIAIYIFVCVYYINDLNPYKKLLSGQNAYSMLEINQKFGGAYRLLLFYVSLILIFCIIAIASNKESIFTIFGQRTLAIYMTHQFFMRIIVERFKVLEFLQKNDITLWPLILVTFGVVLTFLCGNVCFHRFFEWLGDSRGKKKIMEYKYDDETIMH